MEKSPDGGMVMKAQGEAALVLLGQRGSRPARPPAKQARVRVCMCCTSAPAKKKFNAAQLHHPRLISPPTPSRPGVFLLRTTSHHP